MPVPQCLHVILTFLPRTFSSESEYLAEQDVQLTFMKLPKGRSNAARRERACPQSWRNTTRSAPSPSELNFGKSSVSLVGGAPAPPPWFCSRSSAGCGLLVGGAPAPPPASLVLFSFVGGARSPCWWGPGPPARLLGSVLVRRRGAVSLLVGPRPHRPPPWATDPTRFER